MYYICKKTLADGLIIDYMYNQYNIKIEENYSIYLTIGKVYYSDLGFGRYVPQDLFNSIQEHRDINLEILLNNLEAI
jgi:hypothetical protein